MGNQLSTAEAAELAGVDRRTIVNWCQAGLFARRTVGKAWVINARSFEAFLRRRAQSRG